MTTPLSDRIRTRSLGALLSMALLIAATVLGVVAPAPPTAEAAGLQWYNGYNEYSSVISCASIIFGSPSVEAGVGTYVGFTADPLTGQPALNQTFYVEVHMAGLGSPCGGQRAAVELALPAGVTLNVTGGTPIQCFYGNQTLAAQQCPQSMQPSPYRGGAWWYPSTDSAHANTWPLPQGGSWTFRFPVRSSTVQTSSMLQAFVQVLDGWNNPVLNPRQGLFVYNGSNASVLYPNPSTEFTAVPNSGNFTTTSSALIYKPLGQTGNAFFDIATNSAFSPVLFTDPGPVPANEQALIGRSDWVPGAGGGNFALQPNTTYFWRVRYVPSTGSPVTGATQTFTTPSNGNNIVGDGTPASCTTAAVRAAFNAYTQRVEFNCGPRPVQIQLDDTYQTAGPLEIDGKGKVTLVAQPGNRFFDHVSGNFTLKNITLTGGSAAGSCGGAIRVSGGNMTLDDVYITFSSAAQGGAICTLPGSNVSLMDSELERNSATNQGGGVWAAGAFEAAQSTIVGNQAANQGGGIYVANTTSGVDVRWSTVVFNRTTAAGGKGGGMYIAPGAYGAVFASTITTNSSFKGAGIANEGTAWISGATIANNAATGVGQAAGLFSPGTASLRNTLFGGNGGRDCSTSPAERNFTSLGNSLDQDGSCALTGPNDISNVDPRLGPLSTNGGPTRTHALGAGSAAVDAADSVYCGMWDQRLIHGSVDDILQREADGDGNGTIICDIGAFELQPGTVFEPINPARMLDSRPPNGTTDPTTGLSSNTILTVDGESQNLGVRPAGSITELRITNRAGVPADAIAATLNVTATGATGAGYASVFPCSMNNPAPSTSSLNFAAGAAVANAVTSALGVDGKVCVYTSVAVNLIVDVTGYMPSASKYRAMSPARLMDTRASGTTIDGQSQRTGALQPNVPRVLQVVGRATVPGNTSAVMLNVTALGATINNAYVTVYPCGTVPGTSNINLGAGTTVANSILTSLAANGSICVVSNAAVQIIVDIVGYLPGGTTMTALAPARLLDSRPAAASPADDGVNTVRGTGTVTQVTVAGRGGVLIGAKAAVLNVAAIGPVGVGYLTVFPCDQPQPNASHLNFVGAVNRANQVVVKLPTSGANAGKVCIFTSQQTNLIVDVMGQVT